MLLLLTFVCFFLFFWRGESASAVSGKSPAGLLRATGELRLMHSWASHKLGIWRERGKATADSVFFIHPSFRPSIFAYFYIPGPYSWVFGADSTQSCEVTLKPSHYGASGRRTPPKRWRVLKLRAYREHSSPSTSYSLFKMIIYTDISTCLAKQITGHSEQMQKGGKTHIDGAFRDPGRPSISSVTHKIKVWLYGIYGYTAVF